MQNFLTDRPVLTPEDARKATAVMPAPAEGGSGFPFARLVRGEAPLANAAVASATAAGDMAPQVKTVVKDGRVTRIIVTCCCGKVAEIDCVY